jgi:hypothetical protein
VDLTISKKSKKAAHFSGSYNIYQIKIIIREIEGEPG